MSPSPRSEALLRRVISYFESQALYTIAKLDLAEQFAERPKTCAEVAQAADLDEDSLFRMVRALVEAGVFVDDGTGRFSLGPMGECLRSGAPDSMRTAVIWLCEGPYRAAAGLVDTIRTGVLPGALPVDPEVYRRSAALAGLAVVEAVDLGGVQTVVALGAGADALLEPILATFPSIRGSDAMTPDGEVIVLGQVLSRASDDGAVGFLTELRAMLAPAARILVVERLIPRGPDRSFGRLYDLLHLTGCGGRERTEAEYAALLAASGLDLVCVIPARIGLHVLEAVAA